MARAVLLGAYGLIGSACLSALRADGFEVAAVGRSIAEGLRCDPGARWIALDIAKATSAD